MDLSNKIIDYIIERRLQEQDIKRMLGILTSQGREDFMGKVAGILGKVTALLQASKKVSDTLSLDIILGRTISITSEAVGADRGTLFLNDAETGELYSRLLDGDDVTEIRFANHLGIAGNVFSSGEAVIIDDAYSHPSFNPEIDRQTDFRTRNMLCAPIFNNNKEPIGVIQLLNKGDDFTDDDLSVLEAITSQVSAALQNAHLFAQVQRQREQETQLLEMTAAISSELQLLPLLQRIIDTMTTILDADRSTLFLHDPKTDELWSQVAQGMETKEIRFPSNAGIAGMVLATGATINIVDAYADDRFNPEVDRMTGYRTQTILCMPVVNKQGRTIGVTQVLNKNGGPFKSDDEKKLKAFSAQAAIAIENAQLFDEVLNIKNYNESILESLTNAVITLNASNTITKCNAAALRIMQRQREHIEGYSIDDYFSGENQWVIDSIQTVRETGENSVVLDTELLINESHSVSVNLTVVPLADITGERIGTMLVMEDITGAKRLQGTLARYLPKEVAEKVMDAEAMLGGQVQKATILFADICNFSGVSERLDAEETVLLLNDYFTRMVDIISDYQGILDKYIGDALLAVFGTPFSTGKDEDHAVSAAIDMLRAVNAFNLEHTAAGTPPISIGIGINTQEVLAGNIGSLKRMDYTVIGDGVNLAARLESANRFYATSLLVSEFTIQQLHRQYITREVDLMRVKGKSAPVSVYEILDHHDATSFPSMQAVLDLHADALMQYRARRWTDAQAKFQRAHDLHPSHGLAQVYINRCKHFMTNPPADDWDGVWVMSTK